jgi:hypothetical protein
MYAEVQVSTKKELTPNIKSNICRLREYIKYEINRGVMMGQEFDWLITYLEITMQHSKMILPNPASVQVIDRSY